MFNYATSILSETMAVNLCLPTHQQRRIDPLLLEEYCKNFTHGNPSALEFYSPMYPKDYPADITCFRTITADFGYFVRIDFRDAFRIEPPSNEGNCDYDYLEIRDGDQGYSPLIGKKANLFFFDPLIYLTLKVKLLKSNLSSTSQPGTS